MGREGYNLGTAINKAKSRQHHRPHQSSQLHSAATDNERQEQFAKTNRHAKQKAVGLQSNWEMTDLQEYMDHAETIGHKYAEERTTKIIMGGTHVFKDNRVKPLADGIEDIYKWMKLSAILTIPRRPAWSPTMTAKEVQDNERAEFADWRRKLSGIEEVEKVMLTPFERNLEVWRQLWRVVERSDVILMIVDARHPLAFRSFDLERWVRSLKQSAHVEKEEPTDGPAAGAAMKRKPKPKGKGKGKKEENWKVDDSNLPPKDLILILNKADFLNEKQRMAWAVYFQQEGINFKFFSAKKENEILQEEEKLQRKLAAEDADADELANGAEADDAEEEKAESEAVAKPVPASESAPLDHRTEDITHVHSRDELIAFLETLRPKHKAKLTVGTIGYPNVGKSSTINALFGKKKTLVSSTPGKTKHFQTLILNDHITLCDCPGLVFPSFASNRELMVLDGILPIDKLKDCFPPVAIVLQRIPKETLKATYKIPLDENDDVDNCTTAHEFFLCQLARKRGYMTDHDKPHMHKVAREVLKDYVDGVLLFCHPPPKGQAFGANTEHPITDAKQLTYKIELKQGETLEEDEDWLTDEDGEEYDEEEDD